MNGARPVWPLVFFLEGLYKVIGLSIDGLERVRRRCQSDSGCRSVPTTRLLGLCRHHPLLRVGGLRRRRRSFPEEPRHRQRLLSGWPVYVVVTSRRLALRFQHRERAFHWTRR